MQNVDRSSRPDDGGSPFGDLLRTKREAAGLTLTQLSTELGISRPYLFRLERGDYVNPSAKVLNKIIRRLDITVEDAYAVTGYTFPEELPSFGAYVRAKHVDWPEDVLHELEGFYDFLKYKYSL